MVNLRFLCALWLIVQFTVFAAPCGAAREAKLTKEERLAIFDEVWRTIRDRYYDPNLRGLDWAAERVRLRDAAAAAATQNQFYAVLRRMIGALRDSHTRVYAPEEKTDWRNPRVVGVGASAREIEGELTIVKIEKKSAADKAGIRVGDRLTSIDGVAAKTIFQNKSNETGGASTTAAARLKAAATIFGGSADSTTKICWQPAGEAAVRLQCADLRREWRTVKADLRVAREKNVLIVGFDVFTDEIVRKFYHALRENHATDLRGIVLDLRANRGGGVEPMIDAASVFLPAKTRLGKFINRAGKTAIDAETRSTPFFAHAPLRLPKIPIVVLTGAGTASAAEIFAAALKNRSRAAIVGAPTCGCVLGVRGQHALPDGGALELSELDFQLPGGARLEAIGVAPDELVEAKLEDVRKGRDRALERAVARLKNN